MCFLMFHGNRRIYCIKICIYIYIYIYIYTTYCDFVTCGLRTDHGNGFGPLHKKEILVYTVGAFMLSSNLRVRDVGRILILNSFAAC